MKCSRCNRSYEDDDSACPGCGEPNPAVSGVYKSSTVLICSGSSGRRYRSVDEVPARLRSRLEKSTTGRNSATILIADQRGRREISRALRGLPTDARRRILRAITANPDVGSAESAFMTPGRRKTLLAVLLFLVLALLAILYGYLT